MSHGSEHTDFGKKTLRPLLSVFSVSLSGLAPHITSKRIDLLNFVKIYCSKKWYFKIL